MTASAMPSTEKLPVPVLDYPHWRVNFRPALYVPNRLEHLSDCVDVLHKTRVRLRGWDFPPIPRTRELTYGDVWVAGSSDFQAHLEYWRFYQSTQFLYLGSVREVTEPDWSAKLRERMRIRDESVPGFLSVENTIYNITEYFELAARLAQAQIYAEPVTISVSLKGVAGFMLAAGFGRAWPADFVAPEGTLNFSKTFAPADLISSAADQSLGCIVWLFQRFGWESPNIDAIRTDQQKLLTRQL